MWKILTALRWRRVAALAVAASVLPLAMADADGSTTIDGQYSAIGAVGAQSVTTMKVTGRVGIPESGVGAVALNVAVTNPTAPSYVSVWPTGASRPTAANLNFLPGQTVPNMVIVKVGVGGQVSFYNLAGSADLVVDVLGWFPEGAAFTGLNPARLLDTRFPYPTIDGRFSGAGPLGSAGTTEVGVLGRGGVPASGVGSVALNVTAAAPSAAGYLSIWPTGDAQPTAANLNFVAGQTVANMVVAKVGAGGSISLFNMAGATDVVVDVLGWFPIDSSFVGVSPARLMDSRKSSPTFDGRESGTGPLSQAGVHDLTVVGRGGVPATGVGAVALNVTATNPTVDSYLTVWPTGATRPVAANLNFLSGQTVPNMVIATVGAAGQVSIFNLAGSVDVVVDVLGWFPVGGGFTGLAPSRLMDSRVPVPLAVPVAAPAPVITAPVTPPVVGPAAGSCPSDSYVNVDGKCVHSPVTSPSGPPAGATAKCRDGTYSFSQHRSGTCSGHGGVLMWL